MECMYCSENELRRSLMEKLCDLPYSTVYLFRNQRYYGRCVVAFRGRHCTELFELTKEELVGFTADIARVAKSIKRLTGAAKINYGIYGDIAQHVHVHIVPKQKDGDSWGTPFEMDGGAVMLDKFEWETLKKKIIEELT